MPTYVHQFGEASVEFECASCGHSQTAFVETVGTGNLSSIRGAEAGYEGADQDFYENAYKLLDCVACPKCGYSDPGHLRRLRLRAAAYSVLPFALLLLVTWWMMGSETDSATLQAMGIIGGGLFVIGVLPMFLVLRSRWWAGAAEKVRFS